VNARRENPGIGDSDVEKGLSGNPKPELSVRHTLGSRADDACRRPLPTRIASCGGILQEPVWTPGAVPAASLDIPRQLTKNDTDGEVRITHDAEAACACKLSLSVG
jgi:hypothetical protein